MSHQQELLAIFIPSFLILAEAFLNRQGGKRARDELREDLHALRSDFIEVRRDVKAETETLRTIAYEHVQRICTLEVEGKKQA